MQFFCNWGFDAYCFAIRALEKLNVLDLKELLLQSYSVISKYEQDERLTQLWDIPKYLTQDELHALDELDQKFWKKAMNLSEKAYKFYLNEG